jgi:hypothetical protein
MPFITPERLIPEDFFGMTEDGRVIRVKDVNFKKDNLPIEFNEYYTNIGSLKLRSFNYGFRITTVIKLY